VPWGDDARLHLWATAAVTEALHAGELPLWLHPLAAGVPLLQFYPPLGFVPMVLVHLGGLPLHAAFRFGLVLLAAVGTLGAWRAAGTLTRDRRAALVAAAAFAFAPFRLFDAHSRGALGEVAGLAVLPWLVLAYARLLRRPRRRRVALATAAAALALAHLLSAVTTAYSLAAWTLSHCVAAGRGALRRCARTAGGLAVAALVALGLAAGFLLPLLVELDATSVDRIVTHERRFAAPGVQPLDWLGARRSDATVEDAEDRVEADRLRRHFARMPVLPFGATLLAALAMAALQAARAGRAARTLRVGVLAAAAVALAISLAATGPLTWRLPGLLAIQFPWRALAPASVLAALAAGVAAAGLSADSSPQRRLRAVVLFAAVVAEGALHTGVRRWLAPWEGFAAVVPAAGPEGSYRADPLPQRAPRVTGQFVPPAATGLALRTGLAEAYIEYSNPAVFAHRRVAWHALGAAMVANPDGRRRRLPAAPYAEWRPSDGGPRRRLTATHGGGRIRVRAPARPGHVLVREQCFPGWQELVGGAWQPARCSDGGFLTTTTDGPRVVRWRYSPWRAPRVTGLTISLVTLAGVMLARARRRPSRPRRSA
jgi:hypothetical protein